MKCYILFKKAIKCFLTLVLAPSLLIWIMFGGKMRYFIFTVFLILSLVSHGQITNGGNYLILSTCGDGTAAVSLQSTSTGNGNQLVVYPRTITAWIQHFRFELVQSNIYRIISRHSGKSWDVNSYSYIDSARIITWDYYNQNNQQFRVTNNSDGTVSFFAVHSGKAVDLNNSSTISGNYLHQYAPNGTCAQKFRLQPLDVISSSGSTAAATTTNTTSIYKNPFQTIEAERFDSQVGVQIDNLTPSGQAVGSTDQGDIVNYRNYDFQDGAKSIQIRLAVHNNFSGKRIQINIGGSSVGEATTVGTGGWNTFQNLSFNLNTTISGVKDFSITFPSASAVAVIDSFQFSKQQVVQTREPASIPISSGTTAISSGTTTVSSGKRWFPGHYLQATDAVNRSGMDMSKRSRIQGNPNFIGYQVSIFWGQTEVNFGDYSGLYKQLGDAVQAARADGKKLWIRLFERSFHGTSRPRPFPKYISDAGGDYFSTGSENIWAPKLWEPYVKERFILWAEKVFEFAALNPEIVLISNEEYSIQGAWLQATYSAYAMDQLWRDYAARVVPKSGDVLIHLNTGWSTVWPLNYSIDKATLDQLVYNYKVGIGPTDLRKDNNQGSATLATNFGSFMFNLPTGSPAGYQGQAFYTINYEWPDYNSDESPEAHLLWAYNTLGVHFIGWDPDPDSYSGTRWNWNHALTAVNSSNGLIRKNKPSLVP